MAYFPDRNIQTIKMPELDEIDYATAQKAIIKCYDRAKNLLHKDVRLTIHFKQFENTGARRKHEVTARLRSDGNLFVGKETDWNLLTALQSSLKDIERKIKKLAK